jgi:hypothetical protein
MKIQFPKSRVFMVSRIPDNGHHRQNPLETHVCLLQLPDWHQYEHGESDTSKFSCSATQLLLSLLYL